LLPSSLSVSWPKEHDEHPNARYAVAGARRCNGLHYAQTVIDWARDLAMRRILWCAQVIAAQFALTACSTTSTPEQLAARAVPANYRQIIAHDMAAKYRAAKWDRRKILNSEISGPDEGWMGLYGNRPIVCVRLTVRGPFIDQTFTTGFTFENGHIGEEFSPYDVNPAAGGAVAAAIRDASTCGKLTYGPFPEFPAAM
jgi:hypothetical protein